MDKGCLCDKCSALCCRYFVLEIDKPRTRGQFDDVRWYLVHENTFVFIENRKWYLGVYARCKHLQEDNRCGIYETRPNICRKYSTESCDYHGGDYGWEKLFSSAEQLGEYAERWLVKERQKKARRKAQGGRRKNGKATPRRRRRTPGLMPMLLAAAGGPVMRNVDRAPGGNGHANGNGNGNGHANGNGNGNGNGRGGRGISLPLLSR
jgi:Fe-S-cluster containining protein